MDGKPENRQHRRQSTTARFNKHNVTHLNVHRSVDCRNDSLPLFTRVLVTLFNGLCFPVRPKDVVLEHGQSEDVVQAGVCVVTATQNHANVASLEIGHCDVIFACIRPEQFVRFVRDGKRVWPTFKKNKIALFCV